MNKVKVVSAFVPLQVKHLTQTQYHEYGSKLRDACGGRLHVFEHPLSECWAYQFRHLQPATATPADRYETPQDHVNSHIVQHNRTLWALRTLAEYPDTDILVWLDYGILKQGQWNGKPVTEQHVADFIVALEHKNLDHIPFPGIEPMKQLDPFGNNWRFCGSTHIWPRQWISKINLCYRESLEAFVHMHACLPLDLAIWPMVEFNSGLPFRQYKADYDATQLTELPK